MKANKVEVTNFDMPFLDMIWFMIKWTFASIPAAIILLVVLSIILAIFSSGG